MRYLAVQPGGRYLDATAGLGGHTLEIARRLKTGMLIACARDAESREREIRLGAEDYADEIFKTLETNLDKFLAAVQRGRERLQAGSRGAESL